jgi:MFS family permease
MPSAPSVTETMQSPTQANPVLEERLTPYHWSLLFFVSISTLFEGYDAVITGMALPALGKDFSAGPKELGFAMSLISLGTIAAFIPVQLADRYGRRPLLLLAVTGYSIFTVLTALSTGLYDFACYQFIGRALMVTEVGVGAVMLAEELPARYRGVGVTVMIGAGAVGFLLAAGLFSLFADTTLGWRWLYLSGGGLLPLVAVYWRRLQETQRWREQQHLPSQPQQLGQQSAARRWTRELQEVYQPQHRARLWAVTALWFSTNFWSSALIYFFPYYVLNERGWTPHRLSFTLLLVHSLGLVGYAAAGPLLDNVGRRPTVSLYFGLAGLATILCFSSSSSVMISIGYFLSICMMAVWTISATISAEVFPTSMRATANAVANNLLGRIGMVAAPACIGLLVSRVGSVGAAVAVLSPLAWVCIPLVWLWLPETRKKSLEEIAEDKGMR